MCNNPFSQSLTQKKTCIMGVLNVTPDSFSDGGDVYQVAQGGDFIDSQKALQQSVAMIQSGADIIDVGAESSAPNTQKVSVQEEWDRLEKVLFLLRQHKIPFSVDTYKATIAERAIAAGALMINDVTALRGDNRMIEVMQKNTNILFCMMYSKNTSAHTTFVDLGEEDVVQKIKDFFAERIQFTKENSVSRKQILLDPGMGAFISSDPQKSFVVLSRLQEFQQFGCSLLVGTSRKSFLREVSDIKIPKNRTIASITSSLLALQNGASVVRVHDVKEMKEAVDTWKAVVGGKFDLARREMRSYKKRSMRLN